MFKYFHPLEKLNRRRKMACESRTLPQFITGVLALPTPEINTPVSELEYIILDLETTGLDSIQDLILSMGWVVLSKGKVDLANACHFYISQESQIKPETAVINHITPQMLEGGLSIHDAMRTFFEAAVGKIIVAHGCVVEKAFINQYLYLNYHLVDLPLIWVDTLCLEKKMAKGRNQCDDIDLTLSSTRERYGLPEYIGHNALIDAVSTSELFMAQNKRLDPRKDVPFGYLYKMSQ